MSNNDNRPQGDKRGPAGGKMPPSRALFMVPLLLGIIYLLFVFMNSSMTRPEEVTRDVFNKQLAANMVEEVEITGAKAKVKLHAGADKTDKYTFQLLDPQDATNLQQQLMEYNQKNPATGVIYSTKGPNTALTFIGYLAVIVLVPLVLYFVLFRSIARSGGAGILSFGKSRARLATKGQVKFTFDDVAGIDEAKEEVKEIIQFLKNPQKFHRLGARIPRGILLVGAPGTGKTLLAKAIAGEADVPFFSISGSDFVEMFVGVGASRVRDLFRQAKENAPCIIFLDEIDAVGRKRGASFSGGGHDEREQTLNAILVEMDGFESDVNVVVIAATNRPDVLDPALRRPGRFDREVMVDMPDVRGREEILRVHARKIKMAPGIDLEVLARGTPMFSGADLEAIINEAAILATMKGKDAVEMEDLEESRDKVRWGRQKRSRVMSQEDKRITAYHESGHAVATVLLPEVQPLHKVTIIPRGMALGATMHLPEKDRYHVQRAELVGELVALMAGRVAEELFCSDISSGAREDIRQATALARSMVREWGMSAAIGPVFYGDEEAQFGLETIASRPYSEATAVEIDKEVERILGDAYERARRLLTEHRDDVRKVAEALLEKEVLESADVDRIMGRSGSPGQAPAGETPQADNEGAQPAPA
jgi:cell division protease FtsH